MCEICKLSAKEGRKCGRLLDRLLLPDGKIQSKPPLPAWPGLLCAAGIDREVLP